MRSPRSTARLGARTNTGIAGRVHRNPNYEAQREARRAFLECAEPLVHPRRPPVRLQSEFARLLWSQTSGSSNANRNGRGASARGEGEAPVGHFEGSGTGDEPHVANRYNPVASLRFQRILWIIMRIEIGAGLIGCPCRAPFRRPALVCILRLANVALSLYLSSLETMRILSDVLWARSWATMALRMRVRRLLLRAVKRMTILPMVISSFGWMPRSRALGGVLLAAGGHLTCERPSLLFGARRGSWARCCHRWDNGS